MENRLPDFFQKKFKKRKANFTNYYTICPGWVTIVEGLGIRTAGLIYIYIILKSIFLLPIKVVAKLDLCFAFNFVGFFVDIAGSCFHKPTCI